MTELPSRSQTALARLAVLLIVVLGVAGAVWYRFSMEVRQRIWQDLLDRPGGPMTFRIILQPIMAAVAALLDGIKDAKGGRNPYLWTMITNAAERGGRMREGLIATARIILLGLGIDAIYQFSVFHTFYPGEAVIVALILAFVPYVLLRGAFARIARRWLGMPRKEESR